MATKDDPTDPALIDLSDMNPKNYAECGSDLSGLSWTHNVEPIVLSPEAFEKMVQLIENPPPPSPILLRAMAVDGQRLATYRPSMGSTVVSDPENKG